MKSLFMVLFFGALIAFAGAFCEMWTLPYFTNLPTYRSLDIKTEERSTIESYDDSYQAPFANTPNAESSRRGDEMRKAQEQLGGP